MLSKIVDRQILMLGNFETFGWGLQIGSRWDNTTLTENPSSRDSCYVPQTPAPRPNCFHNFRASKPSDRRILLVQKRGSIDFLALTLLYLRSVPSFFAPGPQNKHRIPRRRRNPGVIGDNGSIMITLVDAQQTGPHKTPCHKIHTHTYFKEEDHTHCRDSVYCYFLAQPQEH